jgi:hypothetical protein
MPPTRQHSVPSQDQHHHHQKARGRLEYNLGAEAEEYEGRQKGLEGVAMPMMTRLYQQVMPGGGIVCMPGMSGMGGAASCCQPTH